MWRSVCGEECGVASTKRMVPEQPKMSSKIAVPDEMAPPDVAGCLSPAGGAPGAPRPVGRSWRGHSGTPRRNLVIGDVVALAAAWTAPALSAHVMAWDRRALCSAAAVIVTMMSMHRAGLYRSRVCALRSTEVARTIVATVLGAGVFAASAWLAGSASAWPAIEGAVSAAVAVLVVRWCFGRWLKARRSEGSFLRTVVLVGTNEDGAALWKMLTDEPELGYRVRAIIGERTPDEPWHRLEGCAEVSGLEALARRVGATGVIVVGSAVGFSAGSEAVSRALRAGLHVQICPGFLGLSSKRIRLAPVSGVPMLYVEPRDVAKWRLFAKRAIDLAVTAVICPFAAPLLVIAALLIKLEDRGPVIHRHSVVGRSGVPITVLKLRTMVPNAEQMLAHVAALNERTGGPLFKATYDPRVTRIGRFLRATSVDELPQLWNVLNGTMSLVGPRFALPYEVEQFDEELRRRVEMRPGITGLWQSEARDNPSFSAYRRLDLFYVDNWSLLMDIGILVNTVHAVSVRFFRTVLPRSPRFSHGHLGAAEAPADVSTGEVPRPELATSDQM
jgi:exopolysaccharide biosynthesis polyprenyl glycosylphosphotransferase